MIFERLPRLCTIIEQSSSEIEKPIQPQRPGMFSDASQKRRAPIGRWLKKESRR
jgi:hypothetical protein